MKWLMQPVNSIGRWVLRGETALVQGGGHATMLAAVAAAVGVALLDSML